MTNNELLECLTERPCDVCKFHKENGCTKWECVFDQREQEPKTDVLDKIRAEIADLEEGISSYHNDRPLVFKNEVLEIIDKYKAESEDK